MTSNRSVLQSDRVPHRRYSWLSFSGLLLIAFVSFDFVLLSMWGYGGDWSPLWVAGRLAWRDPAGLYDFALLTKLQLPILGNLGSRPFVYPPSTLTLLAPLSLLPFWLSLACVSVGGTLGLQFVSSRRETDRILLMLSPPVLFAAMIGQPTLIVAALAAGGLSQLKSNETRAGVLLAIAAMLKPTLLLMIPFGLVAGKHWRAMGSGAATACAIIVASILLFGISPWIAWIEALPRFRDLFDASAPLYRNGLTPYALALRMELPRDWIPYAIFPLVSVVVVATFIRTRDWRLRMAAMVGGSLLVTPYAMNYELAALAPVVLTMRREKLIDLAVPLVWAVALFFNASLAGLAAVYLWAVVRTLTLPRSAGDNTAMERRIDVSAGEHNDGSIVGGGMTA